MSTTVHLGQRPAPTEAVEQARRQATILVLLSPPWGPSFAGSKGRSSTEPSALSGESSSRVHLVKGLACAAGIIGGYIGAIFAGRISDRMGRRIVLTWVGSFLLFEAVLSAFSPWLGGYTRSLCCAASWEASVSAPPPRCSLATSPSCGLAGRCR